MPCRSAHAASPNALLGPTKLLANGNQTFWTFQNCANGLRAPLLCFPKLHAVQRVAQRCVWRIGKHTDARSQMCHYTPLVVEGHAAGGQRPSLLFTSKNLSLMQWHLRSLHLNPMENLGGILDRRVYANAKLFDTVDELVDCVMGDWNKMDCNTCSKLIQSMSKRCGTVLERKAMNTDYYICCSVCTKLVVVHGSYNVLAIQGNPCERHVARFHNTGR